MKEMLEKEKSIMTSEEYQKRKENLKNLLQETAKKQQIHTKKNVFK